MTKFPRPKFKLGQRAYYLKKLEMGHKYCEHCHDWLVSHNYRWIVVEFDVAVVRVTQSREGNSDVEYQGPFTSLDTEWHSEIGVRRTKKEAEEYMKALEWKGDK